MLWFVTACLVLLAMKNPRIFETDVTGTPVEALPEQPPVEQKELTTSQNADGSTTKDTTTTVTNADGSKTVTQTTETIPAETA